MNTQKTLVIFALVAVLGLVAIETVDLILTMQAAEARGCAPNPHAPAGGGIAVNASQGRCFH
jgi:hypothetical protein